MKTSDLDRRALEAAIEALCRSPSGAREWQSNLRQHGWNVASRMAAEAEQRRNLKFAVGQLTPCSIVDVELELSDPRDLHGRRTAAHMLLQLLARGYSRWEPHPVRALRESEPQPAA